MVGSIPYINLACLVPAFPLVGFLITGLASKRLKHNQAGMIASAMISLSFIVSAILFYVLRSSGQDSATVTLFNWIAVGNMNIPFAFLIDHLSLTMMLVVTGVGSLIHVYSIGYMQDDERVNSFFAQMNLFTFSMLLLVMGANYLVLFIGWEGVGLCSYLLIGFWFKNSAFNYAARKAFIMNRIGDLGFILGIILLFFTFKSVTFSDVFAQAATFQMGTPVITLITLLLLVGAVGKSAQIPLYTWLPDAMAGPTPVSALIHAATMVTAGIYMIARSNLMYTLAPTTMMVVAIVGLSTAILAATIALKQNDIKKVLAYSTVSQLGYMFLGLGVGAYTGAVFHVMTHAFFKALLFLGAGSVIHAMGGELDIRKMGGLSKHMRITYITFFIGCIAIAGIPPFSGFFSKDEILAGAFAKNPVLYVIGLGGALLTAFYMFRLLAMTFMGKFRGTEEQLHHVHESPSAITITLIILAFLSIVGGLVGIPEYLMSGGHRLAEFLNPIFAQSNNILIKNEIPHQTEILLTVVSTILIILISGWAWKKYKNYQTETAEETGFAKVLQNKWYVDELYDAIIVRPLKSLSVFLNNVIERSGIDGLVNGVGRGINYGSRQIRLLQNGQVGAYILMMVIGTIVLFIIQMFAK